jgi:hypothetical protein
VAGAVLGPGAEHLECGHHTERAVEPAAVRDGVDVRADRNRPVQLARQGCPQVSRLVQVDPDPVELVEAPAQEGPRPLPPGRPADAPRTARAAGQPVELAKILDRTPRVQLHQATRSRRIACIRQ